MRRSSTGAVFRDVAVFFSPCDPLRRSAATSLTRRTVVSDGAGCSQVKPTKANTTFIQSITVGYVRAIIVVAAAVVTARNLARMEDLVIVSASAFCRESAKYDTRAGTYPPRV